MSADKTNRYIAEIEAKMMRHFTEPIGQRLSPHNATIKCDAAATNKGKAMAIVTAQTNKGGGGEASGVCKNQYAYANIAMITSA
jgi:hypothetical protein